MSASEAKAQQPQPQSQPPQREPSAMGQMTVTYGDVAEVGSMASGLDSLSLLGVPLTVVYLALALYARFYIDTNGNPLGQARFDRVMHIASYFLMVGIIIAACKMVQRKLERELDRDTLCVASDDPLDAPNPPSMCNKLLNPEISFDPSSKFQLFLSMMYAYILTFIAAALMCAITVLSSQVVYILLALRFKDMEGPYLLRRTHLSISWFMFPWGKAISITGTLLCIVCLVCLPPLAVAAIVKKTRPLTITVITMAVCLLIAPLSVNALKVLTEVFVKFRGIQAKKYNFVNMFNKDIALRALDVRHPHEWKKHASLFVFGLVVATLHGFLTIKPEDQSTLCNGDAGSGTRLKASFLDSYKSVALIVVVEYAFFACWKLWGLL